MAAHSPQQEQSSEAYHSKDAIGSTIKATAVMGGAGAFISAIQNTLTKQNVGAMGMFTKTGRTITVFASMGAAFEFTKTASANLREKNDTWNSTWGGMAAGSMLGLSFRSTPAIIGYGAGVAAILSAFAFTGGRLQGYKRDPEVDEVSRKEFLRKNRRRPLDETVNNLGEGRGIYGPGYAERRAERLKERYGIDVPVKQPLES